VAEPVVEQSGQTTSRSVTSRYARNWRSSVSLAIHACRPLTTAAAVDARKAAPANATAAYSSEWRRSRSLRFFPPPVAAASGALLLPDGGFSVMAAWRRPGFYMLGFCTLCGIMSKAHKRHYGNPFIVVIYSYDISKKRKNVQFPPVLENTPRGALSAYTAGRALISSGTLRDRNWPSLRSPLKAPFSTTILPRSMTSEGQAARSRPSHGV